MLYVCNQNNLSSYTYEFAFGYVAEFFSVLNIFSIKSVFFSNFIKYVIQNAQSQVHCFKKNRKLTKICKNNF